MRLIILSLLIISFVFCKQSIQITYLANEGVLIESTNVMIILDGLFRFANGYETIPDEELKKIELAEKPYDTETILLVSHPHSDHFNPESVAAHLKNNSKSKLYSSAQVIAAVSEYLDQNRINSQLVEVTPDMKSSNSIQFRDFKIDFLRLRHGYRKNYDIHNLGHIISINDKTIIHIGDAEMSAENFEPFNLDKRVINIGLIPDWFLTNRGGIDIIKSYIKPKSIIAVHVSPKNALSVFEKIQDSFPNADAFTKPLEKRVF